MTYFSRLRLVVNLLPLVQRAPALRRVVSVFTGAKEGRVDADDLQGRKKMLFAQRGHASGVMTLGLEAVARGAPEVSTPCGVVKRGRG